jgi:hypothetical protein
MADIDVPCDECGGKRFKAKVLDIRYRDKKHRRRARAHDRNRPASSSAIARQSKPSWTRCRLFAGSGT